MLSHCNDELILMLARTSRKCLLFDSKSKQNGPNPFPRNQMWHLKLELDFDTSQWWCHTNCLSIHSECNCSHTNTRTHATECGVNLFGCWSLWWSALLHTQNLHRIWTIHHTEYRIWCILIPSLRIFRFTSKTNSFQYTLSHMQIEWRLAHSFRMEIHFNCYFHLLCGA